MSFNNNKVLSTGGGGALICSGEDKKKAFFYANQAREEDTAYVHKELGYNYRLSNVQAMLGLAQLPYVKESIQKRKEINELYRELFQNTAGIEVFETRSLDYESNYWLSSILIDKQQAGFSKNDLHIYFSANGIETRFLWKPMHCQPLLRESLFFWEGFCEALYEKGLTLPSGSNLTHLDKQRIAKLLAAFLSKFTSDLKLG